MKSILMKLVLISFSASLFSMQAIAGGATGFHQVDWLHQRQCKEDQMFEVRLQTAHANPDVCANDKVLEVECVVSRKTKKDFTGQPFDSMAALFRLAFTEDYYVDAWVVGCNGNGYAKVQAVQVQKSAP